MKPLLVSPSGFSFLACCRTSSDRRYLACGVVIERGGPGVDDGLYCIAVALEVRSKHLDGALGDLVFYRLNGGGENGGSTVGELVAVYRRYDGVAEAHLLRGAGDAVGLIQI
jgi:hypothetical protein